jgi:molybdopterin molybdotransferase
MSTLPIKSPSCADNFDAKALLIEQAQAKILAAVTPVNGRESLALRAALGRVLAADIIAHANVPNYHNSAMDGYTVRAADLPTTGTQALIIVGTALAGKPCETHVNKGECIRIMTGAKLPEGADTVIMQEHVNKIDEKIYIDTSHQAKQNVRYAGEDLSIGDLVLAAQTLLKPADLGLIASLGIAEVSVYRRLRVAFFSTGDEIRSLGQSLQAGQIYDSNRYTLYGMLQRLNVDIIDMGVIRDDPEAVRHTMQTAADMADVIITSGGVSVGEADFVKEVLEELGEINFWKVAMKPGRPLAVGKLGNTDFFGLPGNPVSVMATFYQFVQAALQKRMGQMPTAHLTLQAKLLSSIKKRAGRIDFQRGILQQQNGEWQVKATAGQNSSMLSSMSQANCFIILPLESSHVEQGNWVTVQPFVGFI